MKRAQKFFKEDIPFFFAFPAMLWQILFLYVPLFILFGYSLFTYVPVLGKNVFSLQHYLQLFKPAYFKVAANSFWLAIETTVICILVAYPTAYFVALQMRLKKMRTLFIFFLMLPSWMNFIVQVYAWFFLLKKESVLSLLLYKIGLTSEPINMLNNHFSMLVGMVYCYLPFMILPLYSVLEKMDKKLIEASADLGANRFQTFKKVTLPLSMPGLLVGLFLVFIPAFGEFAIPDLLGGAKNAYWGTIIVDKFMKYRNWQSGSAVGLSSVLFPLIVIVSLYGAYRLISFLRRRNVYKNVGSK